ncbi:hypothetical protein AAHE18_20G051400 [Arachis hypogaea]
MQELVSGTIQIRVPHTPIRSISQIPSLRVLRAEPFHTCANRRCIIVTHSVRTTLPVMVALIRRFVPELVPSSLYPQVALKLAIRIRCHNYPRQGRSCNGKRVPRTMIIISEIELETIGVVFHRRVPTESLTIPRTTSAYYSLVSPEESLI